MSKDPWDGTDLDDSARLRDKLLRRQIRFQLYAYSPFYRRALDDLEIRAAGFSGVNDLGKLPVIDRWTLAHDPEDFVLVASPGALKRWSSASQLYRGALDRMLRGVDFAGKELANEYDPVHTLETSGTSGEQIPIYLSRRDLSALATQGKRALEVAGVTASDVILNLLEPVASGAFWPVWFGAVALGARQIGLGPVSGDEPLPRRVGSRATVLIARAEDALQLLGDGSIPEVRLIVTAPEHLPPGLRRRIMEAPGSARIVSTYRFAEGRALWAECFEGSGYPDAGFHLSFDFDLIEALVPRSYDAANPGEPAEIVFTGLTQRGTALARYRTGDIARGGISTGRCNYCGRIVDRIAGPIVRATNLVRLQLPNDEPVDVDVETLAEALVHPALRSWRVDISKEDSDPRGADEVVIHYVPKKNKDPAVVAVELDRLLRTQLGFSPSQFVLADDASGEIIDRRPVAMASRNFSSDSRPAGHVKLWRRPEAPNG